MNGRQITIRKGTPEDISAVGALWLGLIEEVYPDRTPDIEAWVSMTLGLMDTCNEYFMWVAEAEGKIVGFTDYLIQYEHTMSKNQLNSFQTYVLPPYRNTGAANGLWSKVIQGAKDNNCPIIFFSTAPQKYEYWLSLGADLSDISMIIEVATIKEV